MTDTLGSGKVKMVSKEDALISKDWSQIDYDTLQINLKMEAGKIKEMPIEWRYEVTAPIVISMINS